MPFVVAPEDQDDNELADISNDSLEEWMAIVSQIARLVVDFDLVDQFG